MFLDQFKIGKKIIGKNQPAYIIAEIGANFNGSLSQAKKLCDEAKKAGADCAKFQMRHINETYRTRTLEKKGDDLGTEYVVDLLKRFELSKENHEELET